jgi:hypothetical protein
MSDGTEEPDYVFDEARRLRTPTAAAVAGIVFAVLFVTSAALIRAGFPDAPVRSLLTPAVTRIDPDLVRMGLQLLPFTGIAFLWFIGVVRTQFGRHEDQLFATVFLGTGLLLVAVLLMAAAIGAAVLDQNVGRDAVDGTAVRIATNTLYSLLYVIAPKLAGGFVLVTTNVMTRVGVIPRWLSVIGVLVGLMMFGLVDRIGWSVYALPLWVLCISGFILRGEWKGRRATTAAAQAG